MLLLDRRPAANTEWLYKLHPTELSNYEMNCYLFIIIIIIILIII